MGMSDWRYQSKSVLHSYLDGGIGRLTTPPTNPNQICNKDTCEIEGFSSLISFRRSSVRHG